jgi:hypothetical protein
MVDESTIITYKFQGEERSIDFSTPDGRQKIADQLGKGDLYDKKMHEIGEQKELIKRAEQWDEIIASVSAGKVPLDVVVGQLESITGKRLSRAEKKEIESGLEDEDPMTIIKSFKTQIDDLKNQIQINALATQIEGAGKQLANEFDGKNGYPKFDFDEVRKFAEQEGIYFRDINQQYRVAYLKLHEDKIKLAERKQLEAEITKKTRRNESAFAERGDPGAAGGKPSYTTKGKSYDQIVKETMSDLDGDSIIED